MTKRIYSFDPVAGFIGWWGGMAIAADAASWARIWLAVVCAGLCCIRVVRYR